MLLLSLPCLKHWAARVQYILEPPYWPWLATFYLRGFVCGEGRGVPGLEQEYLILSRPKEKPP